MQSIREDLEPFIWWQIKAGNSNFWFDNWTRMGALYFAEGDLASEEEVEVKEYMLYNSWRAKKLLEALSPDMANSIITYIRPKPYAGNDKA
ncbi:MAG: hypothetical protein Q8830_02715 [Candidatus Phytoplasma australasiaticum]|nr:hypothetical protein [Candidatus Phytoplasma australasiaticum]